MDIARRRYYLSSYYSLLFRQKNKKKKHEFPKHVLKYENIISVITIDYLYYFINIF